LIDRLTEIGTSYWMEMNAKRIKEMKI
jgi:hypothetical protein